MHQLVFYVPADHCERVKEALFATGAGRYPGYDSCAWQTEGEGQFRPLPGSTPYLGGIGSVERVAEMRVEMVCDDAILPAAIAALKGSHPYEEPAFTYFEINHSIP